MAANEQDGKQTLLDHVLPSITGVAPGIERPLITAKDFALNLGIIDMVQATVQFHGQPDEDPNAHIANFLEICDTFKYKDVSDDAIRLRLFPFSLKDKAKAWLQSQSSNPIKTWEDLAKRFLARFFPPEKTAKMRSDITNFVQYEGDSLNDAWERYKELIRKCPHNGLPDWLIIQTFYNGISPSNRSFMDVTSGGNFMNKTPDEAYSLLEHIVAKNYYWQPKTQQVKQEDEKKKEDEKKEKKKEDENKENKKGG